MKYKALPDFTDIEAYTELEKISQAIPGDMFFALQDSALQKGHSLQIEFLLRILATLALPENFKGIKDKKLFQSILNLKKEIS